MANKTPVSLILVPALLVSIAFFYKIAKAKIKILSTEEKVIPKTEAHAPPGIKNIGNTCFLNSIIQSLRNLPSFVNFLRNPKIKLSIAKSSEKYAFFAVCKKIIADRVHCPEEILAVMIRLSGLFGLALQEVLFYIFLFF